MLQNNRVLAQDSDLLGQIICNPLFRRYFGNNPNSGNWWHVRKYLFANTELYVCPFLPTYSLLRSVVLLRPAVSLTLYRHMAAANLVNGKQIYMSDAMRGKLPPSSRKESQTG